MPTVSKKPNFVVFNDEDQEVALPCKFEVCPRCEGSGVHDHPAFSNGITSSEWNDEWDEDERAAYLGGRYDVKCSECGGERVVSVPVVDGLSADQKRWLENHYNARAEANAERRIRERGIEF